MGNRPRIKYDNLSVAVIDELEFTKNKCSENARKHSNLFESIEFEIWFDKHYHNREQHGDEDGKRHGIENELVINLINKSAMHLIFYSLKVRSFSFLNFDLLN